MEALRTALKEMFQTCFVTIISVYKLVIIGFISFARFTDKILECDCREDPSVLEKIRCDLKIVLVKCCLHVPKGSLYFIFKNKIGRSRTRLSFHENVQPQKLQNRTEANQNPEEDEKNN